MDAIISSYIQPVALISPLLYEKDIMHIVAEETVVCHITIKKICDALVVLLSTYFMSTIEYMVGKNVYSFVY